MDYPEVFKRRCIAAYPDWQALHDAIDNGSVFVGRYLGDSCRSGVSLSFLDQAQNMEEIRAEVRRIKRCNRLYNTWLDLYDAWRKEHDDSQ